jgi:hypothetical protein
MSYFLVYFEKNNPDSSWNEFNKEHESITETFSKVNTGKSWLKMEEVRIHLDEKMMNAFIIHDGVSSDKILNNSLRKDPVVNQQRLVIDSFIENRLAIKAYVPWFIFRLYHGTIEEDNIVKYENVVEARFAEIKDFSENIKRNYLYKVLP